MEKVILLRCYKTKNNDTCVTCCYLDPTDKYTKGYKDVVTYVNDPNLHSMFKSEDFGKFYLAEFDYEPTFNGMARKIVKKLSSESGKILFQK